MQVIARIWCCSHCLEETGPVSLQLGNGTLSSKLAALLAVLHHLLEVSNEGGHRGSG